jgi:hypothetical protein
VLGAAADDELATEADARRRRVNANTAHTLEKLDCGKATELGARLMHGGERRVEDRRELEVVEAGHRQIARHRDASVL